MDDIVNAAEQPQETQPVPTVETPPEKTFTQSQMDAILKERLDRKDKKYADYGELKEQSKQLELLKKEAMSEQEKAIDEARTETSAGYEVKIAQMENTMLVNRTISEYGQDLLPGYHSQVEGKTEAEIQESIKGVLADQNTHIDGRGLAKKTPAPDLAGKTGGEQAMDDDEAMKLLTPMELKIVQKGGGTAAEYLANKRR